MVEYGSDGGQVNRTQVSSGYLLESSHGYAGAVRVGREVSVSGTTARPPDLDGNVDVQLRAAIAIAAAALRDAGADLRHGVRTVVYAKDLVQIDSIARAHLESFGEIRPASAVVRVAALTPASALVGIEMTAVVHD